MLELTGMLAQAAENAALPNPWYLIGPLGFYIRGGPFMIPLALCQVLCLAVIIERRSAYRSIWVDPAAFRERIKALLADRRLDDAIQLCDNTRGPVSATVAVGLRRFKLLTAIGTRADRIEPDITKAIDDYGQHIVAHLERHLPLLATIAALAPLLGFLGTIAGMVESFSQIEAAAGAGNIIALTAAGIKIALYTTMLGLCIGIPAQLAYNYFVGLVNASVLDVEQAATELVQSLTILTAIDAIPPQEAGPAIHHTA